MIFLLLIIALVILIVIYFSKNSIELKANLKKIFYVFSGVGGFFLLVRFFHPLAALISSLFIFILPLFRKLLNIAAFLSVYRGFFSKLGLDYTKFFSANKMNTTMSREEAYEILGVDKNASKAEINAAYKEKMKKYHPDKGGTKYFAEKLTEARDLLIKGK